MRGNAGVRSFVVLVLACCGPGQPGGVPVGPITSSAGTTEASSETTTAVTATTVDPASDSLTASGLDSTTTTTATTSDARTSGDASGLDSTTGAGPQCVGRGATRGCGWDFVVELEACGYACGGEGEDPAGRFDIACPGTLIEGGACGDLTEQGCCDPRGNAWFCFDVDGPGPMEPAAFQATCA